MYDIISLNGMKVAELRDVAAKLDIKKADKLKKQDLIYKILDEQAVNPTSKAPEANKAGQKPNKSRNQTPKKEVAPVASKEDSTPVESSKPKETPAQRDATRVNSADGKRSASPAKGKRPRKKVAVSDSTTSSHTPAAPKADVTETAEVTEQKENTQAKKPVHSNNNRPQRENTNSDHKNTRNQNNP
ncbi:MAG: Rho termination factor N-terminal domain-containing protein, partial [Flavobacteriales bacterium]